jgi:hypothetical protein
VLWQKTEALIKVDRQTTIELLHHLIEVKSRRLHVEYGFTNLWDMLTRGYGYSEGSAQRRLSAMELIHSYPETEERIIDGRLSLSVAALMQVCLRKKPCTEKQRAELLNDLEGKSTRDAERVIAKIIPKAIPRDKETALSVEHTKLTIVIDETLRRQIEELKALLSHIKPNMTNAELLKYLTELGLKKFDKSRAPTRSSKPQLPPAPAVTGSRRQIPRAIERAVRQRDQNRCTYIDSISGRACTATRLIQCDHIIPVAYGGTNDIENLRLRCQAHNLLAAVQSFGKGKMAPHFRRQ